MYVCWLEEKREEEACLVRKSIMQEWSWSMCRVLSNLFSEFFMPPYPMEYIVVFIFFDNPDCFPLSRKSSSFASRYVLTSLAFVCPFSYDGSFSTHRPYPVTHRSWHFCLLCVAQIYLLFSMLTTNSLSPYQYGSFFCSTCISWAKMKEPRVACKMKCVIRGDLLERWFESNKV